MVKLHVTGRILTGRTRVGEVSRRAAIKVAAEYTNRLRQVTPVDTGRMKASWQAQGASIVNTADYSGYVYKKMPQVDLSERFKFVLINEVVKHCDEP